MTKTLRQWLREVQGKDPVQGPYKHASLYGRLSVHKCEGQEEEEEEGERRRGKSGEKRKRNNGNAEEIKKKIKKKRHKKEDMEGGVVESVSDGQGEAA